MAFEDIKDSIRDAGARVGSQIQESSAFLELQEKYQGLSPTAQKLSLLLASLFGALILLIVPLTFYFSANDQIVQYEDKQQLIRDLFRVSRESASLPPAPPAISSADLEVRARNALSGVRLQPDQIANVSAISGANVPGISKAVDQSAVSINLKKLNLRQLIDAGHQLQLVHPTAKMMGIDVRATQPDPHFFDVTYKIVAFSAKPDASAGKGNRNR
ncbi:MAG: hypothetical protein V4692_10740 [Bdellovibrionota bacterium]